MRESLIGLAAGSVAWAIAVLGIATNRAFGLFLLVVSLLLFIAAHQEERRTRWWNEARWQWRLGAVAALLLVGGLGWYIATNFNEPQSVVDTEARQQTSDLQAKVAALEAQVKAAMDFQAAQKAEREAIQKREDDERRKSQTLYKELSDLAEDGRKKRVALFDLKNAEAVKNLEEWIRDTPAKLRSLSLLNCAEAFLNPVRGARVGYGLPPDRDGRAFGTIALIESVEECRRNHARP